MIVGFFNVNKPVGLSSAAVVGKVKRIVKQKDLGHMGTLDPMASGVLIVAAARPATKMFDILHKRSKEYIADFKFGVDTDTLDTTGNILSSGGLIPDKDSIIKALPALTGKVMQVPPAYSAKSVGGVRAYTLARKGEEVILPPKQVDIFSLELAGQVAADTYKFKITCGGGTYIRSIARDLGAALNTKCVMSALIRTRSGDFKLENAVTLEELERDYSKYLIKIDDCILQNNDI